MTSFRSGRPEAGSFVVGMEVSEHGTEELGVPDWLQQKQRY